MTQDHKERVSRISDTHVEEKREIGTKAIELSGIITKKGKHPKADSRRRKYELAMEQKGKGTSSSDVTEEDPEDEEASSIHSQLPPSPVQPVLQLPSAQQYYCSRQSSQWSQPVASQNFPSAASVGQSNQPPYPANQNVYQQPSLHSSDLRHAFLLPQNQYTLLSSSSQHTQHPSLRYDQGLFFDQTRFSNFPHAQCSYTQSMPPSVTTLSSGDYITPSYDSPGQHPISSAWVASQQRSTQSVPPPSDLCPATDTISAQSPTHSLQSYSPGQQPLSFSTASGSIRPAQMISVCTSPASATEGPPATKRLRQGSSLSLGIQPQSQSIHTADIHHHQHLLAAVDPTSSDPSKVIAFINYLKQKYRVKVVENDKKWSLSPTVEYINLACIDRRCVKNKDYEDLIKDMVKDGNVDTIQEKKGPIQFSEIAEGIFLLSNTSVSESDSKRVVNDRRLILVEGAPGVGKSTFAWEFCRKWWLKKNVAQQYDLVLLLRLRDKGTRNARDLQQLISHPLPGVSEAVCHELVMPHTFHALIILEGYDELPESQRNDSCSIFNQLISGDLLPLATVLVTSRPWATKDIRKYHKHRLYQHIEVLGFTKRQITEYMKKTVPKDQLKDLNSYLERHPQIKSGMYIPLNSAIVVAVYIASKADQQPMPNTITELYTCVVHILVRRHLEGLPELHGGSVKGLPAMNNITVPCEVHRHFLSLCKLAYDGLVSEKDEVRLIFSEFELPPKFDNLGFMDSVTELCVTGESSSSHNFLHLTFQEFFAAVHISTLPPEEQLKYFMKDSGKNEGMLKVTLKFLAGLKKLDCITKETVSSIIKAVVSYEGGSKYQIHPDIEIDIDIVNWMFEAQSEDIMSLILSENKVRFEADKDEMLPMDYYSLGYCISHSKCHWLLSLTGKRGLSKEKIEMLAKGTTGSVDAGRVIGLEYVSEYQSRNLEFFCVELKSVLHLHQLSLKLGMQADVVSCPEFPTLRVLEIDFYSQMGGINLPPSLNSLYINCISLEPNESQSIAKFLSSSPHLKELNLNFYFDERKMEPIFKALATNESLKLERLELHCDKCRMNRNTYEYMITFIKKQKILQYFAISSSTITVHKLRQLLQTSNRERTALQIKFIENVNFNCISIPHLKYKDASEKLCLDQVGRRQAFHKPDLNISDSSVEAPHGHSVISKPPLSIATDLAAALSHNRDFKYLTIELDNFKRTDTLIQALNHDTNTVFIISHTWLGDNGNVALAMALSHSAIQVLELTGVSNDGVQAIANALHHSKPVGSITLSTSGIMDSGATDLAKAIRENHHFQKITLSDCDVGGTPTSELLRALNCNAHLQEFSMFISGSCTKKNIVCKSHEDAAVPETLGYNCSLKCLSLRGIDINTDGAVTLANILGECSSLQTFSCGIACNNDCVTHIIKGLGNNSTFAVIEFSRVKIDCERAIALSQLLRGTTLQELTLCDAYIGDGEVTIIAQHNQQNYTLKSLTLSNNRISHRGGVLLQQNSALKKFILSNNNIGNNGAIALAKILQFNSTLEELDISRAGISNDGARAIAQALQHNNTLTTLTLSSNEVSGDGAIALATIMNSTLQELNLNYNSIGDDGTTAIAEALQHSSALQNLSLSLNGITDNGAIALANALEQNSLLQRLNLNYNNINTDGAVVLARAVHHNASLQELSLFSGSFAHPDVVAKEFVQALTHNSSIIINSDCKGLTLSSFCENYALQCPQYDKVKHKFTYGI